jgi:hypothetical protein
MKDLLGAREGFSVRRGATGRVGFSRLLRCPEEREVCMNLLTSMLLRSSLRSRETHWLLLLSL